MTLANENVVLAHISGASGVGKTTMMRKLKSRFPHLITIDLDCLDSYATRKLGLPWDWKRKEWSQERLLQSHSIRQQALDRILANAHRMNRKVVLFGIHLEDGTEYQFDTPHRICLVRPAEDVVRNRLKRDIRWFGRWGTKLVQEDIVHLKRVYLTQTIETVEELRQHGYREVPVDNFLRKGCNALLCDFVNK